jgi:hypothetical protein
MSEDQAPFVPEPSWLERAYGIKHARSPTILIVGTSWVPDEGARELCKLVYRTILTLNPEEAVSVVDSCSPFDPSQFLPSVPVVHRFDENIGAINRGGGDGAGRALCRAIQLAAIAGYDYVVIQELDFLFAKAVRSLVERMHKAGVKIATPGLANPYAFVEWGIFFVNVAWARETKFVERYDWAHSHPWPLVEIKLEQLAGDDLFLLGLRGMRNEGNQLNVANLANAFPYANPVWLTHCADQNVYARMLELNGVYPK